MARRSLLLLWGALACATQSGGDPTSEESSTGVATTSSTTPPPQTATTEQEPPPESDSADEGSSTTGMGGEEIVPGVGIGSVQVGSRWVDLEPLLGDPDSTLRFGNLLFNTFDAPGLEVLHAAPSSTTIDPDAIVLSVAALTGSSYGGIVTPGDMRPDVEFALGEPSEVIGDIAFYVEGISVRYVDDVADIVTVFEPYPLRTTPPPMTAFEASR